MKSDDFLNDAEKSISDQEFDIFFVKQLGPKEHYSVLGTSKALLYLSKHFRDCADESGEANVSVSVGKLQINITRAKTSEIEQLRLGQNLKRRRLGWYNLILVPTWGLALYGAYMLLKNIF